MMRIAIFGGTGKTGQAFVRQAIAEGHTVVALVRDPTKIFLEASKGFEVVKGSVTNPQDVSRAMQHCDAVVMTLGLNRASGSPWSKTTSPTDLLSKGTLVVTEAMKSAGISRILYMSAFGVAESWSQVPSLMKLIIRSSSVWLSLLDHAKAESILQASSLDWTIVRPVALTDKETPSEAHEVAGAPSLFDKISRVAVAGYLLAQINNPKKLRSIAIIKN